MLQKNQGKIINISSVWGNAGASLECAYSATKGAINSFTKALAKELAPSNIPGKNENGTASVRNSCGYSSIVLNI